MATSHLESSLLPWDAPITLEALEARMRPSSYPGKVKIILRSEELLKDEAAGKLHRDVGICARILET